MEWRFYEYSYLEMKTNRSLARSFGENLKLLGIKDIQGLQTIQGSVDMGNVSHVVPAIHAYLCLGKGLSIPHTKEFAGAVQSREGEEVLALAVKALSLTGWDILTDHSLFTNMRHDFTNQG